MIDIISLIQTLGGIAGGLGLGMFTKSGRMKSQADAFKQMAEAYQYRIDTLHTVVDTCNKTIKELQDRIAELNHALNEKEDEIQDKKKQIRNLTDKLWQAEQEVNRVQDLLNEEKDVVNELLRIENELRLELAQKKCEDIKCPFRQPPTPDTPPRPDMTKEEYHTNKNNNITLTSNNMQTLKLGSRGADVTLLQQKLGIKADGIFGAQTETAVKAYQKTHGCTPDGIVGPHTWDALGIPTPGRLINEIVLHCSATKEGVSVKSSSIDASHKARNFTSYISGGQTHYIGYHYLIHLDGTVEECRPVAKIGCHASGHNANSIGICVIGGLDKTDTNGTKIKDTRTPQQKVVITKLIKELKGKYPTIKSVIGHRDTSPDLNGDGVISPYEWIKGCPCFEASEYAYLVR